MDITEKRFEQDIAEYLITEGGYHSGNPSAFDRELALDTNTFITFIKNSQPQKWERYTKIHGHDSEKEIIGRFCHEVKDRGLLHVMRKGFTDRGITFRAVFWKPETTLNNTTLEQYSANIFHCTRQLHYSVFNENSIDIVLFINGIPVVTLELKCQLTGQNSADAVRQYKFDRASKDAIFAFKERVFVHFAVDLRTVYMTTKLEGDNTYFLPFNQGSNGAGNVGGAGNPINHDGYDTDYLWKNVLRKDRLLEILQKYLHFDGERLIFPRYHQLDAVTKLLADVKQNGSGHNYLIQHSAGSGKSNSIAWLAHRLSGLHNDCNEKIFNSVIIVTDRKILDSQLQETVYQFEHAEGLVVKVDRDSQQLKEAIEGGSGIIVTTLQKFPVIYREVNSGKKRFAVIVDEAHSSQTGEAAQKLKYALADTEEILREYAEIENAEEEKRLDDEDRFLNELAAQGTHENLSFFAFTATPKAKTLNIFGCKYDDGTYHPFHVYSMRQAIEENFILDVLRNYMTYSVYYKVIKNIPDNPELDTTAGIRAIKKFVSLDPHNISEKTTIMLEHFRNVTRHKIGGKAKAMVVTPSRLHALKYFQEFRRQIEENKYGINILVAFSGEIQDNGETYTEEKLNKKKTGETIKEEALPEAFHSDDFSILIVAEKYQTGFDEPLLHTMFIDKKLSGVKAVQTLSRLNRIMKGKQDTFILDFVNSAEDIKKSFEPYYEGTVLLEETDPNIIYDLKNTLDTFRVYRHEEIERFADIFYSSGDIGKLQAEITPALDRFDALEDEQKESFRSTLNRFNRMYAFVTQVCRLLDENIHKFSVYAKFLALQLPKLGTTRVNVDGKILLEYYRLEKANDGAIELEGTGGGFNKPVTGGEGHGDNEKSPLTDLIDTINKKYGTNFSESDNVLLQLENDYAAQELWQNYAKQNDFETFMRLFEKDFPDMAMKRYELNDNFFAAIFENDELLQKAIETIGRVLYQRLNNEKIQPHGVFS